MNVQLRAKVLDGSLVEFGDDELLRILGHKLTIGTIIAVIVAITGSGFFDRLSRFEPWIQFLIVTAGTALGTLVIAALLRLSPYISSRPLRTIWIAIAVAAVQQPYSDFVLWLGGGYYEAYYWRLLYFVTIVILVEVVLWLIATFMLPTILRDLGGSAVRAPEGMPIAEPTPTLEPSFAATPVATPGFVTFGSITVPLSGVIRLSAQGNYVEVVTDSGKRLVNMTFHVARVLMPEELGLQVHRSHWIAWNAIRTTRKRGRYLELETTDGAILPVSRSFQVELIAMIR